ncbi:WD40 repeat domain-containing protein [Cytobacillus suaedae]|nr:WD40 repeat domain-containing protein [Cytobacillus suaedae]
MKKILTLLFLSIILLFSGTASFAAEDSEAINLESRFTKIGPQVFSSSSLTATTGTNSNGTPLMYIILHGTPTVLAVVDLNTEKVYKTFTLDESTSATGLDVDDNQVLWIGGTNNGNIYSYNPDTDQFVNHGNKLENEKDTAILDIDAENGIVFGGSAYGGSSFGYNTDLDIVSNYGQILEKKEFAKSVRYFKNRNSLYIGVGSNAELIEMDISTGLKRSILPDQYKGEKFIQDLDLVGDKLFARMYPSAKVAVFDTSSNTLVDEFQADSRGVSALSPNSPVIYYTNKGLLVEYNMQTGQSNVLPIELPEGTSALSLNYVQLKDASLPGLTLVGLLDNQGTIFTYNLGTKKYGIKKLELPRQPITLHTMIESLDGKEIFINGYMSGGLGIYDTLTGTSQDLKGISQVESMAFLNGKMYFGGYPKGRILEYDMEKPWDFSNPIELFRLEDFGQERPTAMISDEGMNKLFVGTFPGNRSKSGVLAVYDPATQEHTVYENYIKGQSIISFTKHKGYIYGGTSIFSTNSASKYTAKLFRFPVGNPEAKEIVPLPINASLVTGLIEGPNNTIWGMANGTLFVYNPSRDSIRWKEILPTVSGRLKNAMMVVGKDGFVYATLEGRLLQIDPATLKHTVLKESGAYELAQDHNGDLYFRNQADLWKYTTK